MAVNDLTNLQALDYVRDRLKRLGVDKALARAGARQGDTVRIGEMTLRVLRRRARSEPTSEAAGAGA